jgi:hypothetical protein
MANQLKYSPRGMTMKRVHASIAACILSTGTLSLGGAAEAACTNATLKGDYGSTCLGTVNNGAASVALVGKFSFNGKGAGSATDTASINGVIFQNRTVKLTYNVDASCTGSATLTVTNPSGFSPTNFDLVLDTLTHWPAKARAGEIRAIESDAGSVVSCTLTRIGK